MREDYVRFFLPSLNLHEVILRCACSIVYVFIIFIFSFKREILKFKDFGTNKKILALFLH